MNYDPIEQLLKQTDRGGHRGELNPALLADRVLRTIHRRRSVKGISALALVAGLAGVMLFALLKAPTAPEIVLTPQPPPPRAVEPDLDQINREIALREAKIRSLEAMQRQRALASRLASVPATPPEDQVIERAAAAVVFQADRMFQSGQTRAATRAYHDVIAYFPQAISAQTARERIAQSNKAG